MGVGREKSYMIREWNDDILNCHIVRSSLVYWRMALELWDYDTSSFGGDSNDA